VLLVLVKVDSLNLLAMVNLKASAATLKKIVEDTLTPTGQLKSFDSTKITLNMVLKVLCKNS